MFSGIRKSKLAVVFNVLVCSKLYFLSLIFSNILSNDFWGDQKVKTNCPISFKILMLQKPGKRYSNAISSKLILRCPYDDTTKIQLYMYIVAFQFILASNIPYHSFPISDKYKKGILAFDHGLFYLSSFISPALTYIMMHFFPSPLKTSNMKDNCLCMHKSFIDKESISTSFLLQRFYNR